MDALKLIARIAGQRVALPAGSIESVVEIESITPVPLAPPHVAGLAALRSRVLTMIDSYAVIGSDGAVTRPRPGSEKAAVVTIGGHLYGLLVDEVEDVVEMKGAVEPLHAGLDPGWAGASLGLVEHDGEAMLLVDPARLVAGRAAA